MPHTEREDLDPVSVPKFALSKLEPVDWADVDEELRCKFLGETNQSFNDLLNELTLSSNLCVQRHLDYSMAHRRWKRTLILTAGTIALLNLMATNKSVAEWEYHPFPLLAALAAIVLTILTNLESFGNAGERAQAYREARELFVDATRQLGSDWDAFVRPLGDTPEACRNASEMYRRAVAVDRELRARFRKLTTIPDRTR